RCRRRKSDLTAELIKYFHFGIAQAALLLALPLLPPPLQPLQCNHGSRVVESPRIQIAEDFFGRQHMNLNVLAFRNQAVKAAGPTQITIAAKKMQSLVSAARTGEILAEIGRAHV